MPLRGETCSFLQGAANFWLGAYHFDGIRLDATNCLHGDAQDFTERCLGFCGTVLRN